MVLTKLLAVLTVLIMMQSVIAGQASNAVISKQDSSIQERGIKSVDHAPIFETKDIPELRTLYSKTYRTDNGQYKQEISATRMHYEAEDGGLYDIDTRLIDTETFDPTDFKGQVSKENNRKLDTLKENKKKGKSTANGNLAQFSSLQVPYEFDIPKNIKSGYSIGIGNDKLTLISVNASSSKGIIDKDFINKVVYKNVWKSTTLTLTVLPDGIKEDIILLDSEAPQTFTFEVKGDLDKNNQAGKLSLEPMWLIDKEGTIRNVEMITRIEGNRTFIDLKWDQRGLVYPITIDPTVKIDSYQDYRICSGIRYTSFGVGPACTSYLAFNVSSLPTDIKVTSSTFSVNVYNRTSFYATMRQLTAAPTGNMPSYTTNGETKILIPTIHDTKYGSVIRFDATEIVKNNFGAGQVYLGVYYSGSVDPHQTPEGAYGNYYFYTENLGTPTLTITYEPISSAGSGGNVVWKLDTSKLTAPVTAIGGGGYLGSDDYQPGIQIADKGSSSMQMYHGGALGINPSGGQYKAISIQTGTSVGGTNYYTSNGFVAEADKTYKIAFNAYVDSGTGQVRVRVNSKTSSDWTLTTLNGTPAPVSFTWTQGATGGNMQIDTGSTSEGTIVYITDLQITDPSAADIVVWKLDMSKLGVPGTLGDGEYIGSDPYGPGIQILDSGTASMHIYEGGALGINPFGGQYKSIALQTGTAVGGTDYYASHGFVAEAGKRYTVTFNAYVASGTGQVLVRANSKTNGNWKPTALSAAPTPISYTWTQGAIGGNIQIDTGNTPQGTIVYITDLQITGPSTYRYYYDNNGRIDYIRLDATTIIDYTYDNNGNLLSVTKKTG